MRTFLSQRRQRRALWVIVWLVLLGLECVSCAQESNTKTIAQAKPESSTKSPCKPPKPVFKPDPSPPANWVGKGPKSATTLLEVTVDTKGTVHDPLVIQSGGDDVDKEVIETVRQWRFTPATCGTDPIQAKIHLNVAIHLR